MIIAEFSASHLGRRDILEKMVIESASAGADFAKIQTFFSKDLSLTWSFNADAVSKTELSWEDHKYFVDICKVHGITPMTSVYTTEYLTILGDIGFRHIKIGSAQAQNKELICAYVAAGFKTIVSTGGNPLSNLPVVRELYGALHCVSQYPTPYEKSNLSRMFDVRTHYKDALMGYSDHSPNIEAAKVAIMLGAKLIEKHYTVLPREDTKDGPSSINTAELEYLCMFDKLSLANQHEHMPGFSCLKSDQDQWELDTIKKYQSRWKQDF